MPQGVKYLTEEERIEARKAASKRWREKQDRSEYYRLYEQNMSAEKKAMRAERQRIAAKEDPERFRAYRRKNYHKNKHKYGKSREYTMWQNAKTRAASKNVPFGITPEDILIPVLCPVFGIELCRDNIQAQDNSPSLDRIIPDKGYVGGNIAVISHLANTIKSHGTAEQHQMIAYWLTDINSSPLFRPEGLA